MRERPAWRSLRIAFASIWRIRSRVTLNSLPTSSRVHSAFCPMPKRIRTICSSRGVSVAKTLRVSSPRLPLIAASAGDGVSWSSTKSPSELCSSSPSGVSSEIGSLTILSALLDLVERHLHLLGDLFRPRLAAQALHQQARHPLQLVDRLHHMDRDANRPALVGNRTRQRLPNPPRRVSRELEAALVFELVYRPHQANIAFLDKVEESQPVVRVTLGKAHHQPQVGFRQFLLGAPALGLARRDRFERRANSSVATLTLRSTSLMVFCAALIRVAISSRFSRLPLIFSIWRRSSASAASCRSCALTAAGRLLVTLDQRMRIARLLEQAAHLANDALLQMVRKLESDAVRA